MNLMRYIHSIAALSVLCALQIGGLAPLPALADSPMFYAHQGAAISGYDTVAYFTQHKPVRGSSSYSIVWKGVRWQFSSAENLAAFEANPRAYAPQYGGYCAYGLAIGALSTTRPEAWVIHDGKLYLIHNVRLREMWRQDADSYVSRADIHWPHILRE